MNAYFKLCLTVVVIASAVLLIVTLASRPIRAAGPWYVAPGGDDGNDCLSSGAPCATINGAIGKATSGDTIYVAIGTYTGTGGEVVLLDKDATLSGGWDETFTTPSGASTLDGEGARRGMTVNNGVTAILERFTVENGDTSYDGGGIYSEGTLTLNDSMVSGNASGGSCGGIDSFGILSLNRSTVTGNKSRFAGGGICNNGSTLKLRNVSIAGNSCGCASGPTAGAGIINWGTATVDNSTISGNSTTCGPGGGFDNRGDGVLLLSNSTVSGNTATTGGGIFNVGAEVTMQNTILASNTTADASLDCYGTVGSLGYNLVGDTTDCTFAPTTGDMTDVDARLFALVGLPGYHPLLPDSPAIDGGNPAGCTDHLGDPLTTDQRGAPRPVDGDGDDEAICDIGSYEFDPDNNPFTAVYLPVILRNH